MLPTLNIGSIALPTYPLMLLVALWVGMAVAAWQARQVGLDGDHFYNAGLYGLIAGIVGARLWYVLSNWASYAPDLTQALSLSRSALSAGEGLIVAGIVILIYVQRRRLPLGDFLDAAALGLIIALLLGHIGAFLGGEALGAPAAVPWAIEMFEVTRHPVQLYEAGACLLIAGGLYLLRTWRPWPGFQFWLFVALYGLARLILEIFRARPDTIGPGLLTGQLIALTAIIIALAAMAYNFTKKNDESQADKLDAAIKQANNDANDH